MNSSPKDRRSAHTRRECVCTPHSMGRAIWKTPSGLGPYEGSWRRKCILLKIKEAEDAIIASVHERNHIWLIKNISSNEFDSQRLRIASKFDSIYFNEGSSKAVYLATGTVVEAAEIVVNENLDSVIAVVWPPGHCVEANEAMGFCLFNNVAIAASYLLNERTELAIRWILIVDWDVHHGNGTQNMFYSDPRVLYFSVHRYVGRTQMNEQSSKSHFVFTIRISSVNNVTEQVQGVLNLVDLAGSERLAKSDSIGDRLRKT